ncbi:MAG: transglutaminase-like domain-containing protein [Marinilabiliales bacterium]|nr:transglutaminase-like domain-containing protein [Marinilabiliales bacterium]
MGLDAVRRLLLRSTAGARRRLHISLPTSRTSSPMATMLSARGRCGEESTFTVAALRTAGLPARQVYTPRWAHS